MATTSKEWIEVTGIGAAYRLCLRADGVAGMPKSDRSRHTAKGDFADALWFPGAPDDTFLR
jgi:hypothetical protein